MKSLQNIADEFYELTTFLDEIMPPKDQTLKSKVKDAMIDAYSHGYHDGQQAMADRMPKPTDTGGDSGGLAYYESL